MLPILADVIAPIFLIIGAGFLAGVRLNLDRRALGRSVLYIFSPALAFDSLTRTALSGAELGSIVAFVLLATAMLGIIVWVGTRAARLSVPRQNAYLLSTLLMNSGNYGISASLFAFGQTGLERAVMFFTVSQLLTYTLGVYLASRGHHSGWQPLLNIVRLPVSWAMALALVFRLSGLEAPGFLARAATLAGAAAVPVLLVALGVELSRVQGVQQWPGVMAASAVRLGLSIPVGLLAGRLLGISGATLAVCLLQFAMPTAVTPVSLALEFGADPEFVTSVILVTTLASTVTLTLLLTFLR